MAINLQGIFYFLYGDSCWAFSIAFDTAANLGDEYMYLRIRMLVGRRYRNFSHPGDTSERLPHSPVDVRHSADGHQIFCERQMEIDASFGRDRWI